MLKSPTPFRMNRVAAVALSAVLASASSFAQHFTRTDLTANLPSTSATAATTDPNLVNGWGLSRGSTSPWWISDNGTGLSTLYNGTGGIVPLVVKIPGPAGSQNPSTPTGTVFNYTPDFLVAPGAKSIFMFVTEDGTISGWNPGVNPTQAVIKVDRSKKAVYKGMAIASTSAGSILYATNFKSGRVEAFDSAFAPVFLDFFAFRDPRVPRNFAPFNIQNVGGNLVVTFAERGRDGSDVDAPGLGFVSIFDTRGRLIQRLEHGPFLNAPWGIALAPADFGTFAHRLLIGNFGDGTIHAFNAVTGRFEGTLQDANGAPLWIDRLWALSFGGGVAANGSATDLYFTAGPNDENNGLLGKLTPVAADQRGNTE